MSWHHLQRFPTKYVQSKPFQIKNKQKFIYVTRYNAIDENNRGIHFYDIKNDKHEIITLFKDIKYYGKYFGCSYSLAKDKIIMVGGINVQKNNEFYQDIMLFNIQTNSMETNMFNIKVGKEPIIVLTNNDNYLHVIGGKNNDYHIKYNLSTMKYSYIHSFKDTNPQIRYAGIIYHKLNNTLMLFGGYSFEGSKDKYFDDFWIFNLKNNKWRNQKHKKLIQKLSSFGYILYDERIIIIFGGWSEGRQANDSIYYTDMTNNNDGWKQLKLKCPKPGVCHCILVNKTVYIIPRGDYDDHFCIDINDLLPKQLLKRNNMTQDNDKSMSIKGIRIIYILSAIAFLISAIVCYLLSVIN